MKRSMLICLITLIALPAWADWGLSNVVRKEIHRLNLPSQTAAPAVPAVPAPGDETTEQAAAPAPAPAPAPEVSYTKTTHYPYTIHLSSTKDVGQASQQADAMKSRLAEMVFITKINLGAPGTWYRIDYGAFSNIKQAVGKLQELKKGSLVAKDAFVGGTVPYAIELGMYKTQQEAQSSARNLAGKGRSKGLFPYVVKEKEDLYRVLSGAYPDEKSAAPALNDLMSLNLQPALKKR